MAENDLETRLKKMIAEQLASTKHRLFRVHPSRTISKPIRLIRSS